LDLRGYISNDFQNRDIHRRQSQATLKRLLKNYLKNFRSRYENFRILIATKCYSFWSHSRRKKCTSKAINMSYTSPGL